MVCSGSDNTPHAVSNSGDVVGNRGFDGRARSIANRRPLSSGLGAQLRGKFQVRNPASSNFCLSLSVSSNFGGLSRVNSVKLGSQRSVSDKDGIGTRWTGGPNNRERISQQTRDAINRSG